MAHQNMRVAIATNSLGKSVVGHGILEKIAVAKRHGFQGIEVAFECLESHAFSNKFASEITRSDKLLAAARDVYRTCSRLNLSVISLQPFGSFDALAVPENIDSRLEEADLWLRICVILHAPILQVPSCTYPLDKPTTSIIQDTARNMTRLGQLAAKYHKTIAYEAVAWGMHINKWQQIRDVIKLVNLPNVRHCLDTFHITAVEAGDPFNAASPIRPNGKQNLDSSLNELRSTVNVHEIGYLQLSDATTADPDQNGYPNRDTQQPAYMTQSRNCRIFPCEPSRYGGTLPALKVAQTVFEMGYRGWVSMEVFHTDLWKSDESIPEEWARRGMASWLAVSKECGIRWKDQKSSL